MFLYYALYGVVGVGAPVASGMGFVPLGFRFALVSVVDDARSRHGERS